MPEDGYLDLSGGGFKAYVFACLTINILGIDDDEIDTYILNDVESSIKSR